MHRFDIADQVRCRIDEEYSRYNIECSTSARLRVQYAKIPASHTHALVGQRFVATLREFGTRMHVRDGVRAKLIRAGEVVGRVQCERRYHELAWFLDVVTYEGRCHELVV